MFLIKEVDMIKISKNKNPIMGNIVPILIVALVVAAFFVGSLYSKVQVLEKTGGTGTTANTQKPAAQARPTKGVASVDDDPFIGDKDAPITIIEFSDYECPFCKRFADNTLPELKKNYIDTGKVKLVYRDLPLGFHEPMASKEAIAANCAMEQGGNSKYFEYHDEIFNRTISNGNGLNDANLETIAVDLGLNLSKFNTCIKDPKQAEEVKKDLADAAKAGATGTPTFIIGKSTDNGEIDGSLLVGAQPYAAFEAILQTLE